MTATLWIALVAAAGVGGVVTALVTHLLNRRTRAVDIAEKSVRVADAMLTRLSGEVERLSAALEEAQRELALYRDSTERSGELSNHIIAAELLIREAQRSVRNWDIAEPLKLRVVDGGVRTAAIQSYVEPPTKAIEREADSPGRPPQGPP